MLNFTLNGIRGQSCSGKYSDIVTFSKRPVYESDSIYSELNPDEEFFFIEIVWFNSRKTKILCEEESFSVFAYGYEKYLKWLAENPHLEQSRMDLSILNKVLQDSINLSSKNVFEAGELIKNQLIELNKELSNNILEHEYSFVKESKSAFEEIKLQSSELSRTMVLVQSIVKNFVPEDYSEERYLDKIESFNVEIKDKI